MKLTIDEQELLSELIASPSLPILFRIMEDTLVNMQDRLINTPLSATNEKEIFIAKARIDGGSVLVEAIKQRLSKKSKPN
jgi:hypothetical protein